MTKKYAAVYPPLVERLLAEEQHKKSPDSAKAVKTKLHQVYGAYNQDNGYKKAVTIINTLEGQGLSLQTAAESLLALHASTKERLPHYAEFYNFIFEHTGLIESVMDIGCGYNPFSIPLLLCACERFVSKDNYIKPPVHDIKIKAYHAYDIDTRVADLTNRFFAYLCMPQLARCADLAIYTPPEQAEIALMLKLLPVLEAQSPGSGFRLARELNARYLVITYPLKSLGGREKGMARHYSAIFEEALAEGKLGKFNLIGQKQIGPEMVYLLYS